MMMMMMMMMMIKVMMMMMTAYVVGCRRNRQPQQIWAVVKFNKLIACPTIQSSDDDGGGDGDDYDDGDDHERGSKDWRRLMNPPVLNNVYPLIDLVFYVMKIIITIW